MEDYFCGGMHVNLLTCQSTFTLQQLKKQLENEQKRKLMLFSQESKLCEVINELRKFGSGRAEAQMKIENAHDLSTDIYN